MPLHDNTTFALFARATYYDVVTHAAAVVEYRADYNAASSGWQTAELSVALTAAQMLKTFIFNMNVKDGDLTPCLDLSYACSKKDRKHYNLKDTELPKTQYVRGNETIEKWRRLE